MLDLEEPKNTIDESFRSLYENHKVSRSIGIGVPIEKLPNELEPTTRADHDRVLVERITPPYAQDEHKFAALLHKAFTRTECEALIRLAERQGFTDATFRIATDALDPAQGKAIRNNQRIPFESEALAAWLFARIAPFVPQTICGRQPYSLHERVRIVKYVPGTYYKHHVDGYKFKDDYTRSYFSFLLYLNEDYENGRTQFHDIDDLSRVIGWAPRQGTVAVFDHTIWHGGSEVTRGAKYAVKGEVMYQGQA